MKFNLKVLLPPLLTPDLSKAPILLLCFGFPSWPFFLSCFYSVTTFSGLFLSSWVDSFLLLQLLTVLLLWPHLIMNVCVCFVHVCFFKCFFELFLNICVCFYDFVCVCRRRGEGWRHPQALPPIYPSQETPPPKDKLLPFLPSPAASWETAHSSVSTHTRTHALTKKKPHISLSV